MKVGDLVRSGPVFGLVVDFDPEYGRSENLRRWARESQIAYIRVMWNTGQAFWEREDVLEIVT
tara:strand:- start:263 stop:451 length:189 start_codon:yes stop_codon:yes gene_type:complete